jgi:hypothetical protein
MNIIQQQILLHFGDDYHIVLEQARKYVAISYRNMLRWGANRNQLLDNEGGRVGLLTTALLTIIEVGEVADGLKRFSNRLATEYLNGQHAKWETLEILEDMLLAGKDGGTGRSYGDPSALPQEGYTPLDVTDNESQLPPLDEIIRTGEELELYTILASVPDLREAAALMGVTYDHAKTLNNRVGQRLRYRGVKRGYYLSAATGRDIIGNL